jgi:RNA polymerase sigma-70 factor (ECF subfamily)
VELDTLYDRFGESLYRFLLVKLGSPEDARDVLQETFCRLARYTIRWPFVRDPKAFVFKAARNEANRFLRRWRLGPAREISNPGWLEGVLAAYEIPNPEIGILLQTMMDHLSAEQREVLSMKVFDGLTFKEIGSVCGISANTAASRYRYAVARLRSAVEGKE